MTNDKLTFKDSLDLVVEAGIGAIPIVGGTIQTLYFGAQNEKKFKRIERFYKELNEELEIVKDSIPDNEQYFSQNEFIAFVENINSEVEKAKNESKINYFKSMYKNILLYPYKQDWNKNELCFEIMSSLTNLEVSILIRAYNYKNSFAITVDQNTDPYVTLGSLNRLSDLGLLIKTMHKMVLGAPLSLEDVSYQISDFGKYFCEFVTQQ